MALHATWVTLRRIAVASRAVVRRGSQLLATLFVQLFGRWHWQSPGWIRWSRGRIARSARFLRTRPLYAAAAVAALIVAAAGYAWYASRPKPHYVTYTIVEPALTEYDDNGIKSIKPLTVLFAEAAAPLSQVQKPVTSGIELSPAIAGSWFWSTDRELQFAPKEDWPVDGAFSVRLAKSGFAAKPVRLASYSFRFKSQPFTAQITESQFYQDPRDPNQKKLVATLKFSHPVDGERLLERVSLAVAKDAEYLGLAPNSRNFTVALDKFHLTAYVHSVALQMPRDDTPMTLVLDRGVRAARGGNDTAARQQAVVTIPGRTSLRFSDARMTIVDNARYEPEQIVLLKSSSPVVERAFAGNVTVQLLPERHPRQPKEDTRLFDWRDAVADIGQDILSRSEPVNAAYVPSDEGGDTTHGFKVRAPVGRYLIVMVKDGVQGIGGYISGKPLVAVIKVRPYRRALTFLGQGSLLSVSGDRKVGFLVRDLDQIEVEIGRVLPNQLQHLSPRMWDFSKPVLYDTEDRLVERFSAKRDYSTAEPGKPTYDSIDLSEYLRDRANNRGLFMLHLRESSRKIRDSEDDDSGQEEGGEGRVAEDTRLILVTDLGFAVKQAKDGARDVFVQSIRTGLPVEGVRVELVGANGLPVAGAATDASGAAHLAPPTEDMRRERQPDVIVAQKDGDFSFMPLNSGGRELNFSRFDTGGVENAKSRQQLSAYLFSDRGIYRPGETAHLGIITRTGDWKASLSGLPIDIEVTDSRGTIVSRNQLTLSTASFDEIAYTSQPASPTGTYQVVAYLPRERRPRETLGATSFRVQEFEPDRMKVQLELTSKPAQAWLKSDEVKARLTVAHLFGEPASNRRVDGELSLSPALPRFSRYADYRFQIGDALKDPYHEALAARTTDASGTAEFTLDLKRFAGRAYRLDVLGRAYEAEGGRNVAAETSAIVSDAPYLVGVKADGNLGFVRRASVRQSQWLAVNQQLEPVAADNLTLEWVQRKYLSVLTQQSNRTFKYVSRRREIVRDSRSVRIGSGGGSFPLPTQEPGDFALVLRDASGTVLNSVSYAVAGQANLSRSLERNAELQVQLDKPAYGPGSVIEVSIRAPYVGAGLITIERERVFRHQWFKTTTTSSVQRITLPDDFEGNGYVTVQFLRDPSSDEVFTSPLSYGVAPFGPDLSARKQEIRLAAPRVVKPGATLVVHVDPAEASRVAVLAVDEGILQVARYQNPDPLGYFFQKRMLEVDTRQILDLVLPEFKRFMALAAAGGDAEQGFSRHLNPFNRKRKAPVAYWSGVVDVGPEGRDLRYTVPDYFNGRLRIVALAASPRRIGIAAADTEVRGDFILTPNVPVMAAPGDEFLVSVGVFNNTAGAGAIRVELQGGSGLAVQGASTVDLNIAEKKEGVGEFRIKASAPLGAATLKFTARRAAAEAHQEESISIRPPVAYRSQLAIGRVDASSASVPVTRDLYSEHRQVQAAVSLLPLVWGEALSVYLQRYEYSCTEQLVSQGFGSLVLAGRPEFGAVRSREGEQPIDATLSVLRSRSNYQGGFGLWSSAPQTAEFPTVYAAHFLIEARERGQRVPPELLARVNNWLTQFASTPASTLPDGRLRAYAVYLLVRQGMRVPAPLSNVEQELSRRYPQTWGTDLAAAYLAATYRLMQRTDDAERIIRNVPWSTQKKDTGEEIYYDPVVHDAQLLYLLSRHFPARLEASAAVPLETISSTISRNHVSSLTAAYTLLAVDAFARAAAPGTSVGISEIAKDGRERPLTLPSNAAPRAAIAEGTAKVQFSKRGPAPAYYSLNESGFDRTLPAAEITSGLEIIREFVDSNGAPLSRVTVGQEFFVRLRLRTVGRPSLPQIAVVDLLPAGVEPVLELRPPADSSTPEQDPAIAGRQASALPIGIPSKSDWTPAHVDVRDDRLVLYGDARNTAGTFVYRVRATSAGTFQTPPAFAEGMYNRAVVGMSRAGRLEVVKP
ncbi:MAG TPA: MG2 domain-containing protein [Vicinamibacterales bacterium]|jgi:hypothetical protein